MAPDYSKRKKSGYIDDPEFYKIWDNLPDTMKENPREVGEYLGQCTHCGTFADMRSPDFDLLRNRKTGHYSPTYFDDSTAHGLVASQFGVDKAKLGICRNCNPNKLNTHPDEENEMVHYNDAIPATEYRAKLGRNNEDLKKGQEEAK